MFDFTNFENLGTNKNRFWSHALIEKHSRVHNVILVLKKQQRRCYTLSRIIVDIVERRFHVGKKQELITRYFS